MSQAPADVRKLLRPDVLSMSAYTPGEQRNLAIKLNTNECAWPPSPKALKAAADLTPDQLRLYPDPLARALREQAAELAGVTAEQVLAGNGSDDCLTILYRSILGARAKVVCPWPTYGLYDTLANIQGAEMVHVPYLQEQDGAGVGPVGGMWRLPVDDLVATDAPLTLIANPNNPSGTRDSVADILQVVERASGVVVVDEAYVDFVHDVEDAPSLIPYVDSHPNLVVLRTCSKSYSLAGARVGFLYGNADLVAQLMKVKDSYNVNVASQAMALAAMRDTEHLANMVRDTRGCRAELEAGLARYGWTWPTSQANFLLCRVGEHAGAIMAALRERNLLVRWWDRADLRDRLRITVGTPDHQALLLAALDEILAS